MQEVIFQLFVNYFQVVCLLQVELVHLHGKISAFFRDMKDLLYLNYIDSLAKEAKNEEFFNSSEEHAKIVLTAIMRYAKRYVNIYCESMMSEVSNNEEYLKVVQGFLEKGGNMNILLNNYDENIVNKGIYKILSYYPNKIKIKKIEDPANKIKYNGNPVHFTVADGKAFRLETDIVNKKAWGNFNDPVDGKVLDDVFYRVFSMDKCSDIKICNCKC